MKRLGFFTNGENKRCVFTGHRILEADFNKRTLIKVIKNALKSGVLTYYSGMAAGFDLLATEILLSFKKEYPSLRLIACIPCEEQDKYFSAEEKRRYLDALALADEKIVLSPHYYNGCMHVRNKYMVERADCMIAYCKHPTGGTAYTVKRFQKARPDGEIVFL